MALVDLDAVLRCLAVTRLAESRWTAPNIEMEYRRIFGGQLVAQAIALATATGDGKTVKSMSCLFPREGSLDEPLEFEVQQPHSGRTFATRQVRAAQRGKTFFIAQVSLHTDEEGVDHHAPMPEVGAPADAELQTSTMIPWSTRAVDAVDLHDRAAGPATFSLWNRVEDRRLPDDRSTHQALAAYATDLNLIATTLRPLDGLSVADAHVGLQTAVTSHSMWFHRPFRIDEWCLLTHEAPSLSRGRGFGRGDVFTADGTLVASFAQESMIRAVDRT